jgi:hypothetical protein
MDAVVFRDRRCGYSHDFDPVILKPSGTVVWADRKAI